MENGVAREASQSVNGSLRHASVNRLACLVRHWAWADEALARVELQLAGTAWPPDPSSDHTLGTYCYWGVLLGSFSDEALEKGLLSTSQLAAIRGDLEASRAVLHACRQLLRLASDSPEEQQRQGCPLRDEETHGRLRRIHEAFGRALREERSSREIDSLSH
jgi:hypothetical protein